MQQHGPFGRINPDCFDPEVKFHQRLSALSVNTRVLEFKLLAKELDVSISQLMSKCENLVTQFFLEIFPADSDELFVAMQKLEQDQGLRPLKFQNIYSFLDQYLHTDLLNDLTMRFNFGYLLDVSRYETGEIKQANFVTRLTFDGLGKSRDAVIPMQVELLVHHDILADVPESLILNIKGAGFRDSITFALHSPSLAGYDFIGIRPFTRGFEYQRWSESIGSDRIKVSLKVFEAKGTIFRQDIYQKVTEVKLNGNIFEIWGTHPGLK